MIDGRDIPWLQGEDGLLSEIWALWNVTYRDVIILDAANREFAVFNLTQNDLANVDRRDALKSLLRAAAEHSNDPANLDGDRDGLPDPWELRYFDDLAADPRSDTDSDGMTEDAERIAGTDPTDAASVLAFTRIEPVADQSLDMTWISVPDREYSLEYREGSEEGWVEVDRVVATGIRTTRRHDRPASNQHGQYRLRIVP